MNDQPAAPGPTVERIAAHIEQHLGKILNVFPDATADSRILLHHVPATDLRPIHTLVTSGMSAHRMAVPEGVKAPQHIELMMTLPRQWRMGESLRLDEWRWPLAQLHKLARIPQATGGWLGWGQAITNGEPPQPVARGTALCGFIIAPSLFVPQEFYELKDGGRDITFLSAIPLYKEELELHRQQGMEALLGALLDNGIQDVVDVKRRNVTRKQRFGWF